MKWLLTPLLWLLALGLVVLVAWRLWRGKPVVLRGRWSPRVIRMVAILLVILGVGAEQTSAAQLPRKVRVPASSEPSPDPKQPFTTELVERWLSLTRPDSPWTQAKQGLTLVQVKSNLAPRSLADLRARVGSQPGLLRKLLLADLDTLLGGKAPANVPVRDLLQALAQAEQLGYFDHWLASYLWRASSRCEGDATDRIELYQKLARHARFTNALIKARPKGQGLLMGPRAWMSKAGPRPLQRQAHQAGLKAIADAANVSVGGADLGTWERDGLTVLTPGKEGAVPTLFVEGSRRTVEVGKSFRFHRLDLLQTPAGEKVVLHHPVYGKVEIPGGKLVSVHELPAYLSDEARRGLVQDIGKALEGSEEAAGRVEKALPLAHQELRKQLEARPTARGAARMRLILALFVEVVMPAPTEPAAAGIPGRSR